MESIGEKIRKVREEKGYSLDQVARDTHITKRFLEALESENFAAMPGESYVVGFMRSYSEYLGLDADEMVSLYKNLKLQEQPAPMSELLERTRLSRTGITILSVLGVIVVVVVIVLVVLNRQQGVNQTADADAAVPTATASGERLDTDVIEKTFSSGDTFTVPVNGVPTAVALSVKAGQPFLTINGNSIQIPLNEESPLDLNQDGKMDLKVLIRAVDVKSNPARVVMRLDRVMQSPQGSTVVASPESSGAVISAVPEGQTTVPSRVKQVLDLVEYDATQPINLGLQFDAATVFRYETAAGKKEERLAGAGENVSVSSPDSIRFWIANGGKVTLKIGTREMKAGNNGEVVAYELVWGKSQTGARQLELSPLY